MLLNWPPVKSSFVVLKKFPTVKCGLLKYLHKSQESESWNKDVRVLKEELGSGRWAEFREKTMKANESDIRMAYRPGV